MVLLIGCDNSSLVIDKLCDEAPEEDSAVICFYFDFAARNEQSPVKHARLPVETACQRIGGNS